MEAMDISALIIHPKDNVATAVRPLPAGERLRLSVNGGALELTLVEDIAQGHKLALTRIGQGEPVVKYGETIGLATLNILAGEHVHVHNVEGRKGRGDRR